MGEVTGEVTDEVDEGLWLEVEDGEAELRQLATLELATIIRSEDPPERPCASVIVKIIVVPAATSAIHEKLDPDEGDWTVNDFPLGMSP